MRVLVACDPGVSGGIAICLGDGVMHSAFPMPDTTRGIVDLLSQAFEGATEKRAVVEEVGGYIGENQPGSAAFVFGKNFGTLLGVLQTLNARIELVKPQVWQKALGLGTSGRTRARAGASQEDRAAVKAFNARAKAEWKRKLKEKAEQLYPALTVTLKTADCLLLLEYARLTSKP